MELKLLAIVSCSRSITEAMVDAALYNICLLSPWGSKRKKKMFDLPFGF